MLTINYDPHHNAKKPWLVLGINIAPVNCLTLQKAIAVVVAKVKINEEYRCGLWDMADGSWAFSILDSTDDRNYEVLLFTPHSELPLTLQTYGQMLPCKYRS